VKGIKIPGHVNKKSDNTTEKLIQMRIDFHEQRRQQLINQVKIMRARVIQDEQMGVWENPDEYGIMDPDNFN